MKEPRLSRINIMADYGEAYAWDENGGSIGLDYNFPDIPEVKEIEKELEDWALWFWKAEENDPKFPWDEKGRSLAVRLRQAIRHTGVEVYYDRPYEDPQGKNRNPERIE